MKDMLVICPTLWRREKVDALLRSWVDVPHGPATDLALVTDQADPSYDHMDLPAGVRVWTPLRGDIGTTAEKTNVVAVASCRDYRAIMSTGDDAHFMTPDWDQALMEPVSERPGISYPDMDGREVTVPGICVLSSEIIRELGWMFLPTLKHYWADNVWYELGLAADCLHYVPGVVFHDAYGPQDPTYERAQHWGAEDQLAFLQWKKSQQFHVDVASVRRAISSREQQADFQC